MVCILQVEDATVAKYLDMGHNKEAIQYALQTYGDDQTKVGSYYSLSHCCYLMFPIEYPYHCTDEGQSICAENQIKPWVLAITNPLNNAPKSRGIDKMIVGTSKNEW